MIVPVLIFLFPVISISLMSGEFCACVDEAQYNIREKTKNMFPIIGMIFPLLYGCFKRDALLVK
jgi:hypothetical protein